MPVLPNAANAILDLRKLEDYCLDTSHPRGRHKARVFRDALALSRHDAGWLRNTLLDGILAADAQEVSRDRFGSRWRADVPVARQDQRVVIRTVWIVRTGETPPRFLTCWVL